MCPYRGLNDLPPHPDDYADVVRETLGGLGLKLALEPGRMIAGNAGILVTRVLYVKEGVDKTFTIVDAAMNDLLRPTLYDAFHDIWPVIEEEDDMPPIVQDIVGPVCETGDYLAQDRRLPPFAPGDLMAVMTAGAYGAGHVFNLQYAVPYPRSYGERLRICSYQTTRDGPGPYRSRENTTVVGGERPQIIGVDIPFL